MGILGNVSSNFKEVSHALIHIADDGYVRGLGRIIKEIMRSGMDSA